VCGGVCVCVYFRAKRLYFFLEIALAWKECGNQRRIYPVRECNKSGIRKEAWSLVLAMEFVPLCTRLEMCMS
jgi:hypothetical protein